MPTAIFFVHPLAIVSVTLDNSGSPDNARSPARYDPPINRRITNVVRFNITTGSAPASVQHQRSHQCGTAIQTLCRLRLCIVTALVMACETKTYSQVDTQYTFAEIAVFHFVVTVAVRDALPVQHIAYFDAA